MLKKLSLFSILMVTFIGCDNTREVASTSTAPLITPIVSINTVTKTQVKSGQGLFQALQDVSIENTQALAIINELRDEVEFSKLKVGDELVATFDEENTLIRFSFSQSPVESHVLNFNKETKSWNYSFDVLETVWQPRLLEGELRPGSTLEADLLAEGLERSVVNVVVNVLLCKVNFRMNARNGDKYKVLLNERMFNDQVVGTKVLFTSYSGVRAGTYEAFYYEDNEKSSTYTAHYTEDGTALISSGLRYPLPRLHVRSGYGWRRHPVTGKRAMHRGVDLRARNGAKVHAAAAGKVILSSYDKYAGNKIGIRHRDGSISYYYHLSKRGVNKGDWVKSHQVIGRVGATGRVTGAHLHFGFKKANGQWMNPLNKRMIATPKLSGQRYQNLTGQVAKIRGVLADLEIIKQSQYLVANYQAPPAEKNEFGYFTLPF